MDEAGGDELLFADGFDEAIIGIAYVRGSAVAVYDEEQVVEILASQGMSLDESREYFDFNVVGAYVGEQTPIFVRRLSRE